MKEPVACETKAKEIPEIVTYLREIPFVFENISKEAAKGDPFAYYATVEPSGTCFKIADFLKRELGADKTQQLAIGIGGDFNHTAVLFDGELYIDASMPLIIHDIANDVSYSTPNDTELKVSELDFNLYRNLGSARKGPFAFKNGVSNSNVAYEKFKYSWVWDKARITNNIIVCKSFRDGFLHEIVLDRHRSYNAEGLAYEEKIPNSSTMAEMLVHLGVRLQNPNNYDAYARLFAKQKDLAPRMKAFLLQEFV